MGRVSEIGEQLWTGELSPAAHHPWAAVHDAVAAVRASVYARRAERETSLMARGLYRWAADRKR